MPGDPAVMGYLGAVAGPAACTGEGEQALYSPRPPAVRSAPEEHPMDVRQVYEEYVRPLPLANRLRLAERIVAQAATEATQPPTPVRASSRRANRSSTRRR